MATARKSTKAKVSEETPAPADAPPVEADPSPAPAAPAPTVVEEEPEVPTRKARVGSLVAGLADEVQGKQWGTVRTEQIRRLAAAGYDYNVVLGEVDRRLAEESK